MTPTDPADDGPARAALVGFLEERVFLALCDDLIDGTARDDQEARFLVQRAFGDAMTDWTLAATGASGVVDDDD